MARSKKHKWNIDIGDWSNDGHGKCESKLIESNLTHEEAREAFFKAKEKLGKSYPEEICHEYEDHSVTADMLDELKGHGFEFEGCDEDGEGDERVVYPYTEGMLQLTLWFIKVGNPDFKYKIINPPSTPSLAFYGFDKQKRHISFIGYGVLGD
jgi:hypothetical protein